MNDDDDHDPSTIGDSLGGSRFRYFWFQKCSLVPAATKRLGCCVRIQRAEHTVLVSTVWCGRKPVTIELFGQLAVAFPSEAIDGCPRGPSWPVRQLHWGMANHAVWQAQHPLEDQLC